MECPPVQGVSSGSNPFTQNPPPLSGEWTAVWPLHSVAVGTVAKSSLAGKHAVCAQI